MSPTASCLTPLGLALQAGSFVQPLFSAKPGSERAPPRAPAASRRQPPARDRPRVPSAGVVGRPRHLTPASAAVAAEMASDFSWAPLLGAGGYSFPPALAPGAAAPLEVPPFVPPLPPTALAHVQLAAAAAEVQARAQAHIAQAAQLMLHLPRPEAVAPLPVAEAPRLLPAALEEALHSAWQPGMTLRLAAAGLTPPALPAGRPPATRPPAVRSCWSALWHDLVELRSAAATRSVSEALALEAWLVPPDETGDPAVEGGRVGKPPAARPRAAAERAPPLPGGGPQSRAPPPASAGKQRADEVATAGLGNASASVSHLPQQQLPVQSVPSSGKADGELKKQQKDNLRHHLQEMRAEDPRCIFIARRINKLGFRSKALLEKHYSQFGEVTKIMVAHSKVKPDPSSGTMPRTRPGNFGLVVMRSPEAVKKILQQGSEQTVGDFAIQVHQFQEQLFEDAAAGKEGAKEAAEAAAQAIDAEGLPQPSSSLGRQESEQSAGSCDTGNSGDGALETPEGSSGNSQSSASCNADEDSQSTTCTNMTRMDLSSHLSAFGGNSVSSGSTYKASSSSYDRHCSNGNGSNGSDDYSSQGGSSGGSGRRRDDALGDQAALTKQALDDAARRQPHRGVVEMLNELGRIKEDPQHGGGAAMEQSAEASDDADRDHPHGSLVEMLNQLSRIAKDQQDVSSFTREQSAEAASLAHWAQRSLVVLESECMSKIDEINSLADQAAPRGGAEQCSKGGEAARSEASAERPSTGPKKRGSGGKRGAGGARERPGGAGGDGGGRLPVDDQDADGGHRDTLRSHLTELLTEDPHCVFITRRINKLGFRSREILKRHYSQDGGEVLRVLVAHSKVKPFRDSSGQMRTRPGGLGLIVMKTAEQVRKILALGEEQDVAGQQIRVHCFQRPKVDEVGLDGSGGSGESTAAGGATLSRSTRSQRSGSNGNGSDSNGGSGSCSAPKETSGSDEGSGSSKRSGRGSCRAGPARGGSSAEEAGSSGPESQESSR
ncbi:unnamed protein product [Prorocentrum cordatum]|uniref:Uncharacterized protein n=1 Tax=Prorocentrum cordatum TaxID=2364126 RepID=A0ABN9UCJ3_9DINO|nr:unnamed protein product [Polarella glacialis]